MAQKKTALNPASPAPVPRNDGLIARYEELRRLALGRSAAQPQGLALFMSRGMGAWMQAWSQCVAPPPETQEICPVRQLAAVAVLFTAWNMNSFFLAMFPPLNERAA